MNAMEEVVIALETASKETSMKGKKSIISKLSPDAQKLFCIAAKLALDPYITYGIKPDKTNVLSFPDDKILTPQQAWNEFLTTAKRLSKRECTGVAAKTILERCFYRAPSRYREFFYSIISKTFAQGIAAKTVNSVYPGTINEFEVQLAESITREKFPSKKVMVEPKLDGLRIIILADSSNPRALSRKGIDTPKLQHVADFLAKVAPGNVFDGEVYAGSWEKSITAAKNSNTKGDEIIYLFDVLPIEHFLAKHSPIEQYKRKNNLKQILQDAGEHPSIRFVPHRAASSYDEVESHYLEFLVAGFEGAVAKDPHGLWIPGERGRGKSWWKFKEIHTDDYEIIGVFEGEKDKQFAGSLGGVIIDVNGVEVRVGSGFKATPGDPLDRNLLWRNRERIIGMTAEVGYQSLTPDGSLRHPRIKRIRSDK